jgi:transposase
MRCPSLLTELQGGSQRVQAWATDIDRMVPAPLRTLSDACAIYACIVDYPPPQHSPGTFLCQTSV